MDKKINLLFYNGSLRMGGIERVLVEVLQNINREKINIDLIIEDGIKSLNIFEKYIPQDIKIYYLKSEKIIQQTNFYKEKRKNLFYKIMYNLMMNYESYIKKKNLKKIVEKNKYDIVIDFDMGLSKYIDLIDCNKKIAWIHASIKDWYKRDDKIKRLGKRLKKYTNVVTICDEMKEETLKLYPFLNGRILRIYNPFNFERIISLSEEKVDNLLFKEEFIISVSRLTTYQKDFETLIKSFKQVKKLKNIQEKLYILGDGPDRDKIKEMIVNENMEKEIILVGNVENPYPWIKKAKLFVHSSKYEGLPTVLIEALILGKIVISSACSTGPTEILEKGEIGYLYEVGDYKKLAEIIYEKLENLNVNKELINERIKKYRKENIIKEYENLILNERA